MSLPAPELSILIVSYNTRDLLRECLASVFAAVGEWRVEVIVVDNASGDGSARMVAAEFPRAALIANAGNVGFAAANNQAYRVCQAEHVLLLNPDTVVKPSALADMLRYLREHPNVGIVAAHLLNPDGTNQPSVRLLPTIGRNLAEMLGRSAYVGAGFYESTEAREIEDAIGACLMVRRAALADDDLLDERFFLYAEDKDLCRRVGRSGWRLVFLPWARVVHYGGRSAAGSSTEAFVQLQKSQLLYYHKHFSRPYALGLSVTWSWVVLSHYLAFGALWCVCPGRRAELRNVLSHFRAANAWLLQHLWRPERPQDHPPCAS